jgi:hypothetical protein
MTANRWNVLLVTTLCLGTAAAVADDAPKPAPPSNVEGEWTGLWGPYNPAQSPTLAKDQCKRLDCKVVKKEGVWQATFEGECGRPYKYTIKMDGRQAGGAVLFKGTTDLGPKDGGVFDWVGRATAKEFVGFYTSANYTGVFHLAPGGSAEGKSSQLP